MTTANQTRGRNGGVEAPTSPCRQRRATSRPERLTRSQAIVDGMAAIVYGAGVRRGHRGEGTSEGVRPFVRPSVEVQRVFRVTLFCPATTEGERGRAAGRSPERGRTQAENEP